MESQLELEWKPSKAQAPKSHRFAPVAFCVYIASIMKKLITLLATIVILATVTAQAGNPELDHLRTQYAGALDLLRNRQADTPAYVAAVDLEIKRLEIAAQTQDLEKLLTSNKWVRTGRLGRAVFTFKPDGTMDCGKTSKFAKWTINKDGTVTMGTPPAYQITFRPLADGRGMVATHNGVLVLFEIQP